MPITPVGLHYLLTHYDIPAIDPGDWRLVVEGRVARPLELSYADLLAMPAVTETVTLECSGNGRALLQPRAPSQPWLLGAVGTARWTGVPLTHVLDAAGVLDDALEVVFTGADRGIEGGAERAFARSLSLADATADGVLLAHGLNGAALPPQHGFPLRLVVPGWYGMASVKWLTTIRVSAEPFTGYHQSQAFRLRQTAGEPGEPLRCMAVRSLLVPPGVPDFLTRVRTLAPGRCTVVGRAWSGGGAIASVQVSTDGGDRWEPASVDPPEPGAWAWQGWRFEWDAPPGEHELCCRATDAGGGRQPLRAEWNLGGYANNAVQRVRVVVADGA